MTLAHCPNPGYTKALEVAMFILDRVVPWGRSFEEYRRMFALSDADLQLRILVALTVQRASTLNSLGVAPQSYRSMRCIDRIPTRFVAG